MKIHLALLAALGLTVGSLRAQITVDDPAYQFTPFVTHTSSDNVVSYDWGANGSLYYQTATPTFNFGGLYQYSGGTPTQAVAGSSDFSGASVVSIGNYVYYNTGDFSNTNIYKYGPIGGSPSATLASTTVNFGLYTHGGNLFITGAPGFGTNHIYYSSIGANGALANSPAIDLGADSGGSGPLAFGPQGDLFYAPGFGDLSIYRWSAADVAAAMADPIGHPLSATGHLWLNYSGLYGNESGGTSMLIDSSGHVLLTLTSFTNPSVLARFGIAGDGSFDGASSTLLEDTSPLGELREHDGSLFFSSGNQIFQVVPEPSSLLCFGSGLILLMIAAWRGRIAEKA
jgi:hypothetical protein